MSDAPLESALQPDPATQARVERGLAEVRARIEQACRRVGRDPGGARLLAVSKKQSLAAIVAGYAAGQREFGENYVQELAAKREALAHLNLPDLRFRLIGHLQKNKAKDAARLGCAVDTLDSAELADVLDRRARGLGVQLEVMIEVNVDGEPQKAGVLPASTLALVEHVRGCEGLLLSGLMCIPRPSDDPEQSRAAFARLRELGERARTRELSMGMSDDFEVAVEEGATLVRVGTAIFGARS